MPMGIEAAVAMLACARIGAVHMGIFAGFSPRAIADRVDLSGAAYVIVQARSMRRETPVLLKEMVDEALERVADKNQVKAVVVFDPLNDKNVPMKAGRDIAWADFLKKGEGQSPDVVQMESNEPLFVLPTSGTTAKPKVTVQNHGGYQVYCYSQGKWIYNLNSEDIWFCTSVSLDRLHSYNI
jgi:acetyl-CoA synthetase